MEPDATKRWEWDDMLVTITDDDTFVMTGAERGLCYSLLANLPEDLTPQHLEILARLRTRYSNHLAKKKAASD